MPIELIIILTLSLVFIVYYAFKEKKDIEKEYQNSLNKIENLEIKIKKLEKENQRNKSKNVEFVYNEYTYNNKKQLVKTRVTEYNQVSLGKLEHKKEYIIKSKFKENLLILEELFNVNEDKFETLDEYYVNTYDGNKNTMLSYSIEDGKPILKSKQIIDISKNKKSKTHLAIDYDEYTEENEETFIYEKFDDNYNLIELIQISSENDNLKNTYIYENNLKIKKKEYKSNNNNFSEKNLKMMEKYFYNHNKILVRKERDFFYKGEKHSKVVVIIPLTNNDYEKAISESIKYCELNELELNYLKNISSLLFENNISFEYMYYSTAIKIEINKTINIEK